MDNQSVTKSINDLDQDEIYDILGAYLAKVGAIPPTPAQWGPLVERAFKEHCYFGLGIPNPVMVPHSVEAFHPNLFRAVFGDTQIAVQEVTLTNERTDLGDGGSVTTDMVEGDENTPPLMFKQHENGDLSFALQTGLNQVVPPTTEQALANQLTESTAKVADEIETGDVLTKETIEQDKAADEKTEADADAEETAAIQKSQTGDASEDETPENKQSVDVIDEDDASSDVDIDDDLDIEGA